MLEIESNMKNLLKGKNVIVTGASSGIGREISLLFSEQGANILAVARNMSKLDKLVQDSSRNSGKIISFSVDLLELDSASLIIAKAKCEFGKIDILINNAGIGYEKDFSEQNKNEIDSVLTTNLISPINLTKEILPEFIKNKEGVIFFVTSLAGKIGFPKLAPYSASKFGIEGFAETVREELKDKNIKIVVVRPGVTDTDFFDKAGMHEFYYLVKLNNKIHSANSVAEEIIRNMDNLPEVITIGSDKIFLKILPLIPYKWRFRLLSIVNLFN